MTRRNIVNSLSRWLNRASVAVLAAALAAAPAHANPLGGKVVGGSATIAGEGTAQVTVTQSTDRAIVDWDSFSIVLARDSTHTFFCRPLIHAILDERL